MKASSQDRKLWMALSREFHEVIATQEERELWVALSDIFVDTETDFPAIARVAKQHSMKAVEFALFERVAPVCIFNVLIPVPPVCWGFDQEELVSDICLSIERESRKWIFGKLMSVLKRRLIRLFYADVWRQLKAEMEKQKAL